jgi:hypothetical protein
MEMTSAMGVAIQAGTTSAGSGCIMHVEQGGK